MSRYRVTVLEGSPRLGGKLSVSEVAGVPVDEGAEALLVTRPEGTGLIAEVGLADERVAPGTTSSAIWTLGELRPLPRRQFMGVPSDLAELARTGVVSGAGVARASQDLELPPTARDGDVPVAEYVGARLGPEVVDRLVDPLLGGVYAGRSAELSFDATLPALAAAVTAAPLPRGGRRLAAPAAASAGRPGPGTGRDAVRRVGVHHARRGTGPAARRPGQSVGSRGPDHLDGANPVPGGGRAARPALAAEHRIRGGAGAYRRRRGDPRRTRAAGQPPAGAGARRVSRRHGARRDQLRQHGHRHAGLPACRVRGAGLGALGWSGYLVPAVDGRTVKAVTFSSHQVAASGRRDGRRGGAAGDRAVLGRTHRRGSPAAAG